MSSNSDEEMSSHDNRNGSPDSSRSRSVSKSPKKPSYESRSSSRDSNQEKTENESINMLENSRNEDAKNIAASSNADDNSSDEDKKGNLKNNGKNDCSLSKSRSRSRESKRRDTRKSHSRSRSHHRRSRSRSSSRKRKRYSRSRSRSQRRSRSPRRRYRSPRRSRRSRSRSVTPVDGARLHVAEIDVETRKRDLEKLFESYGRVREIWMARNPPCFAFVVFERQKDADRALHETEGMLIGHCRIKVTQARPRVRGGRFRGGGYDPNLRCYQCGELGHFSRNCTDTKFGYKRPETPPGGVRGSHGGNVDGGRRHERSRGRRSRS